MSIPLAGFRLDDTSIPTDTDDSSSISPTRQSRRYSAWDSHTQPSPSPVLAAHGPAPLLSRETTTPEGAIVTPSCDQENILAPAPLFSLAGPSTASLTRTANDDLATPSNIVVSQHTSPDPPPEMERSITPRPIQGPNDPVTNTHTPNTLVEPESSQTSIASTPPASPAVMSTTIQERRFPGTQLTTTLPPPFRVATERGLRLSPSIISRQPLPILRLPVLPVPTPTQETPVPPTVHLRHVPSLSVHGRPRVEPDPDSPADEDEDCGEDDNDGDQDECPRDDHLDHQSDEDGDGEEFKSSGTSYSQPPLREMQTPAIDLTPRPIVGPSSKPFLSPYSPAGASSTSYNDVSSKTFNKPNGTTPIQDPSTSRLLSPKASFAGSIHARSRLTPMTSFEVNHGQSAMQANHHPGLYRRPSRSMIDLSVSRKDLRLKPKKSRDTVQSNTPSVSGNTIETVESGDTDRIVGKLMRRTSMPTFTASSDPPPYPSFDPRPQTNVSHTLPREDEGRERLPPYSNSLYLSAIMPCKMEFSSPGVQAKDRKWRRVFCELEGTLLRVYKCPPGASGAGIIGEWWERRVGVGDLTSTYHAPRRRPDEGATSSSSSSKMSEQPAVSPPGSPLLPPNRQRSESQSSRATNRSPTPSTSRGNRRMSGASFLATWRSNGSSTQLRGRGPPSTNQAGPSGGIELLPVSEPTSRRNSVSSSGSHEERAPSTPRTPRASSRLGFLSSKIQMRNGEIQKPGKGELIRTYTLQHAECGLGNDYLKRKNVIRVRLEGEQFLLQAADVPSVVEWIEVWRILAGTDRRLTCGQGFQAGTNIALDLDQRVMPKGPMFPRWVSYIAECKIHELCVLQTTTEKNSNDKRR